MAGRCSVHKDGPSIAASPQCWGRFLRAASIAALQGAAAMTIPRDPAGTRNLVRVVSACTSGLLAFAAGLLIGVFLFS